MYSLQHLGSSTWHWHGKKLLHSFPHGKQIDIQGDVISVTFATQCCALNDLVNYAYFDFVVYRSLGIGGLTATSFYSRAGVLFTQYCCCDFPVGYMLNGVF